MFCEGVAFRGR